MNTSEQTQDSTLVKNHPEQSQNLTSAMNTGGLSEDPVAAKNTSKSTEDLASTLNLSVQTDDPALSMNLSDLNQDCHVYLFNRLHLTDLLHLRKLCHSLNASFFVHSRSRHSLVLKIGDGCEALRPNDLVCRILTEEICTFLVDTYPNVTHLSVYIEGINVNQIAHVCWLLNEWSPRLKSLKVFCPPRVRRFWVQQKDAQKHMSALLAAFNRMPVLTSLHFQRPAIRLECVDMPVFSQLEVFTYNGSRRSIAFIYDSIIRYAVPNVKFKTISLWNVNLDIEDCRDGFVEADENFTKGITFLDRSFYLTGPELARHAHKFCSLTNLHLKMATVATYLPLNRVSYLLATYIPQITRLILEYNFAHHHDQEQFELTPMPSIKSLDLIAQFYSHEDIEKYLKPAMTLPNVEKIEISFLPASQCIPCELTAAQTLMEFLDCRELIEEPFIRCPKLAGMVQFKGVVDEEW